MKKTTRVEKTVTIDKPAEELYQFWHNFENLPCFDKHLKNVKVYNDKRSHWVSKGPANTTIEWDADITQDRKNELIGWSSVEGSDIDNSGLVLFKPAPGNRGTEVKVIMTYNLPPGGAIGEAFSKLSGDSPEQQIGDALRHFKMLMETGEMATTEGQPKGKG